MDQKKYHYYTLPELLGHLLILAVVIVSVTGGLRLVEIVLPTDQPVAAETTSVGASATSVTEYLHTGYLQAGANQLSLAALPSL